MVLITLTGLVSLPEVMGLYHWMILVGLLFCIGGDVALMWPTDKFIIGLISFLIGHLFYIVAFNSKIIPLTSPITAGALLLFATVIFGLLNPFLAKMKIPVAIYIAVISIMGQQAWERYFQLEQFATMLAATGALFFMISDTTLAWNRFRRKIPLAQFFVLSTYYTAQLLIALSLGQTVVLAK
ncbi:MAG: lysoplasmalogenase [Bdellovibrionales bacterium]|jgi:uncharacterized membrane protein YhhN|nr:lysoplasmalogenase [Bdellovibrionales bacterium]